MVTGQKPPGQKPRGQKPPDNKPPRIIEKIIVKYAVDANLFRLGSSNPKKKFPAPGFFSSSGFYDWCIIQAYYFVYVYYFCEICKLSRIAMTVSNKYG